MAGRKLQAIRLSEAAVLYYRYMEDINLRPNTVNTAKSTLRGLEHVIGNKIVSNIDWQDVTRYLSARKRDQGQLRQLSPATMNLQMHRLKAFFEWAVKFHYIDPANDPMAGRRKVEVDEERRRRVEAVDFPRLLDAAPNPRDRMVIAMGLYTMMRSGEIRKLRWGNINFTDQLIPMKRYKTNRRDELAICTELELELKSYKIWYAQNIGREIQHDDYLVPTNQRRMVAINPATHRFAPAGDIKLLPDTELYQQASSGIVKAALNAIGWDVTAKEGGHTLRRSAARELFESLRGNGFDDAIMTVMSWLGHQQPLVTMKYLGLEREAERRNKLYKGRIMYPRAVEQTMPNVTPLRAVGDESV